MRTNFRTFKLSMLVLALMAMISSSMIVTTEKTVSAAVLWVDSVDDTDSDVGTSYYADIDTIAFGTYDNDPDNIMFLIYPYFAASSTFFVTGYGSLSFDINGDSVDDFVAYAPRVSYSYLTPSSYPIVNGSGAATGCYSEWSMSSSYSQYAVEIPWTCLGRPSQFRVEGWLSNSSGFDFLDYGRTIYPVLTTPTTTTTTTVPLVIPANTSTPGMVDNWIEYLVVKQAVTLTAVLNTTNCCYGAKKGVRTMTVLSKSKGSCVVRGKRIYPLKKGTCWVKVTVTNGKSKKTETLKLPVRTS